MGTPAFPEDNGKNKRTAGVVKVIDGWLPPPRPRISNHWPRSVRRKPPSVRHTYSLVEIGQKKGMDGKQILA
jgi:hypothetical protein